MNPWLQLGLGGAALFLLYVFISKLFKYLEARGKSDSTSSDSKFDRLCDKIDKLVEAFYATNKKEEVTTSQLGLHYDILLDIKDKVTTIDVRTTQLLDKKEVKDK